MTKRTFPTNRILQRVRLALLALDQIEQKSFVLLLGNDGAIYLATEVVLGHELDIYWYYEKLVKIKRESGGDTPCLGFQGEGVEDRTHQYEIEVLHLDIFDIFLLIFFS